MLIFSFIIFPIHFNDYVLFVWFFKHDYYFVVTNLMLIFEYATIVNLFLTFKFRRLIAKLNFAEIDPRRDLLFLGIELMKNNLYCLYLNQNFRFNIFRSFQIFYYSHFQNLPHFILCKLYFLTDLCLNFIIIHQYLDHLIDPLYGCYLLINFILNFIYFKYFCYLDFTILFHFLKLEVIFHLNSDHPPKFCPLNF